MKFHHTLRSITIMPINKLYSTIQNGMTCGHGWPKGTFGYFKTDCLVMHESNVIIDYLARYYT